MIIDNLLDIIFHISLCDLVVVCVEGEFPWGTKIMIASGILLWTLK